ncbi:hypothetical protein P8452_54980 [Trifolium repens]|nr:hypothetical protein P8452_54980 [Trifolium repens]
MIVFFSIFNTTTAMDINCRNDEECRNDPVIAMVCFDANDIVVCKNPNTHLSMCVCLTPNLKIRPNIGGL